MSHFAKVLGGRVIHVIVAEPDFFNSFVDTSPGQWIQTSYNTYGNIHYGPDRVPDGGVPLRGNYAGIGYVYDAENDVFYAEQPYLSWVLNKQSWLWEAPVPYPTDGQSYTWDEPSLVWVDMSSLKGAV
jgi:hypothetical protein